MCDAGYVTHEYACIIVQRDINNNHPPLPDTTSTCTGRCLRTCYGVFEVRKKCRKKNDCFVHETLFTTALKPNFYVQYNLRFELTLRAKACNPLITWREEIGIKLVVTWLTWKSLIASVEDSVRVLSLCLDAISMNSKFWEVNKTLYEIRQNLCFILSKFVWSIFPYLQLTWPADHFRLIQNCPSESMAILISIFLSLGLE